MDEEVTYKLPLELDEADWRSINEAMALRQRMHIMPDGGGNLSGRLLAEICRGWLEILMRK